MTPGAMRLTPALDGELIWSDSVPDAAPLRGRQVPTGGNEPALRLCAYSGDTEEWLTRSTV